MMVGALATIWEHKDKGPTLVSSKEAGSLRILWNGVVIRIQDFSCKEKNQLLPCLATVILGLCY